MYCTLLVARIGVVDALANVCEEGGSGVVGRTFGRADSMHVRVLYALYTVLLGEVL